MLYSSNVRNFLRLLCLASLSLLLVSCAQKTYEFWRQVPIQLARVSQQESYRQTFTISTPEIESIRDISKKNNALDQRMDRIFIHMLGSVNWQYLKNHYGIQSIRNELMDGKIHMEGLINFNVYLDHFVGDEVGHMVIEGSGRFFAIRDKTNAILMSGDFKVFPQRYTLSQLEQGCFPLDVNLYTTRIPGETTFYQESVVRYDIIMNLDRKDQDTYSIDYDSEHMTYLDMNDDGVYDPTSELIASMVMNNKHRHVKLFDLSGRHLIKNTYELTAAEESDISRDEEYNSRQCVTR